MDGLEDILSGTFSGRTAQDSARHPSAPFKLSGSVVFGSFRRAATSKSSGSNPRSASPAHSQRSASPPMAAKSSTAFECDAEARFERSEEFLPAADSTWGSGSIMEQWPPVDSPTSPAATDAAKVLEALTAGNVTGCIAAAAAFLEEHARPDHRGAADGLLQHVAQVLLALASAFLQCAELALARRVLTMLFDTIEGPPAQDGFEAHVDIDDIAAGLPPRKVPLSQAAVPPTGSAALLSPVPPTHYDAFPSLRSVDNTPVQRPYHRPIISPSQGRGDVLGLPVSRQTLVSGNGAAFTSASRSLLLWRARYETAVGEYHCASGERAVAMARYVRAWTLLTEVHGPNAVACVPACLAVADIALQLGSDGEAWTLLEQVEKVLAATELIHGTARVVGVWATARRIMAAIEERRRRISASQMLLREVIGKMEEIAFIADAQRDFFHAAPGDMPAVFELHLLSDRDVAEFVLAERGFRLELALCHLQCSELETCDDGVGPSAMDVAFRHCDRALRLLTSHLPQTHPTLIRAQLRLARLFVKRSLLDGVIVPAPAGDKDAELLALQLPAAFSSEPVSTLSRDECFQRAQALLEGVQASLDRAAAGGEKVHHLRLDVLEALGDLAADRGNFIGAIRAYTTAAGIAGVMFAADHETPATLRHKRLQATVTLLDSDPLPPLSAEEYRTLDSEDACAAELRGLVAWRLGACEGTTETRASGLPIVTLLHDAAVAERLCGRFDDAMGLLAKALTLCDTSFGGHGAKARVLGAMAKCHRQAGDLDGALRCYASALSCRRAALGSEHMEVAASYGNLAEAQFEAARYTDAKNSAEQCMNTVMKVVANRLIHVPFSVPAAAVRHLPQFSTRRGTIALREELQRSAAGQHPFFKTASHIHALAIRELKSSARR